MSTDSSTAIAQVIQLSVAPVFLLMALGTFLSVLSLRLGRIIDRSRVLEARDPEAHREELARLRRRRKLVNVAISCGTFAALIVCMLIACAFIGSMIRADFAYVIAGLFITAMIGFMGVLVTFLAEIRLAQ